MTLLLDPEAALARMPVDVEERARVIANLPPLSPGTVEGHERR